MVLTQGIADVKMNSMIAGMIPVPSPQNSVATDYAMDPNPMRDVTVG